MNDEGKDCSNIKETKSSVSWLTSWLKSSPLDAIKAKIVKAVCKYVVNKQFEKLDSNILTPNTRDNIGKFATNVAMELSKYTNITDLTAIYASIKTAKDDDDVLKTVTDKLDEKKLLENLDSIVYNIISNPKNVCLYDKIIKDEFVKSRLEIIKTVAIKSINSLSNYLQPLISKLKSDIDIILGKADLFSSLNDFQPIFTLFKKIQKLVQNTTLVPGLIVDSISIKNFIFEFFKGYNVSVSKESSKGDGVENAVSPPNESKDANGVVENAVSPPNESKDANGVENAVSHPNESKSADLNAELTKLENLIKDYNKKTPSFSISIAIFITMSVVSLTMSYFISFLMIKRIKEGTKHMMILAWLISGIVPLVFSFLTLVMSCYIDAYKSILRLFICISISSWFLTWMWIANFNIHDQSSHMWNDAYNIIVPSLILQTMLMIVISIICSKYSLPNKQ